MPPLEDWLRAVVETPGLTALDLDAARGDAARRRAAGRPAARGPTRARSSTSAPGTAPPGSRSLRLYPSVEVVLLEAERRRCAFLEEWAPAERPRGLRAGRGAADRLGGRGSREGARPAAGGGRVVPAARPGGRHRGAVGRRERRSRGSGPGGRPRLPASSTDSPRGPRGAAEDRPDAGRLPAPYRGRPQAAAG